MATSDFRRTARESLRGKWGPAVLAGLIASLLGNDMDSLPKLQLNFNEKSADLGNEIVFGGHTLGFSEIVEQISVVPALLITVVGLLLYIVGSAIAVGYARWNLDLIDGSTPTLEKLFSFFPRLGTAFVSRLLRGIYTFLWSLLLFIPGIVAAYKYRMTDYILNERPELTANEAIACSKEMMHGYKWDLFCLDLSFIGWDILAALTLGIGYLWLTPYKQASYAAFYRRIAGTK